MLHEKGINVARGTEVDIRWLKVDWTDYTSLLIKPGANL